MIKQLVDPNKLCMGCMNIVESTDAPCPYCGFLLSAYIGSEKCLQPYEILNGKYMVGRVLGIGGFGITYIGWDFYQCKKIAIKEYFPKGVAERIIKHGTTVYSSSLDVSEDYMRGLSIYLREAENLSGFYDLDGIVSVRDFFYGNKTAYIVMEYIDGIQLKQFAKACGGVLDPEVVFYLLKPVVKALMIIHKKDIIHRDISPDNIMIDKHKKVKLIDFGAAKNYEMSSLQESIVLKYGYAPIEQYAKDGKQGPWTDIYALCATMYYLMSGRKIPEAKSRVKKDTIVMLSEMGVTIGKKQENAIMKGLSIWPDDRYQTMEELYNDVYM
ncbi:MAG: serine/threonine protein kinase [Eubacterium sp.]